MKNTYSLYKPLQILLIIILSFVNSTYAQHWTDNLSEKKIKKNNLNFSDFQKAFYETYPKDIVTNGTINQGGNDVKIPGWKLFKRWEWFMETRVEKSTGKFPVKSALQVLKEHNQQNPQLRAAINGGGNWTTAGPSSNWSGYYGTGRLNCVAFHPNDNNTFWVGAPGGGLWKTIDGGTNWSVSTDDNDVLGVSTIALHPDFVNNNTIFIGTGDRDGGSIWTLGGGQSNDNNGIGVLKSTDGGNTWNSTGLTFTPSQKRTINEVKINPNNSSIILAATNAGIYKSSDGGNTWSLKTSTDDFVDMDYKPGSPSIIYASTTSWSNSKIFKSTDDGDNWTEVLSVSGRRIQLAVSPNNSNLVYAVAANSSRGLEGIYKSTNSGTSFTNIFSGTSSSMLGYYCDGSGTNSGQGSYDLCLAADPNDENILFLGGVNTWKSSDGGQSWTSNNMWTGSGTYNSCSKPVVHADKHYLAFQNGSSTLFECNDGGIYKTTNGGSNWSDVTGNMMTSQIYKIGVDPAGNDHILNGLQDNGTKSFKNNVWSNVTGGDGMECIVDYDDPNIQYACIQNGKLRRTTNSWLSGTTVITDNGILNGLEGAWVSPYVLDPNDHNTIYLGFEELYKSTDKGDTWSQISNLNVSSKLKSVVIAPSNNQIIFMSDHNNLWKTTNGGGNWSDISGNLPNSINSITYIAIKNNDPNTIWITIGGYNNQKVYQSSDGGSSWTDISNGLLPIPVMSIVQNKQNTVENELYVGTDVGVYQKIGNNNWTPYCTGLPNVVVTELEIYYDQNNSDDSKLWAGTFGRGLWSSALPSLFATQNPSSFNANAVSQTQIDLSWNKNLNNDNIVLAWSSNASFGIPTNGLTYNPGDNITGGGTVVYAGSLTNFNHTSLTSNTKYYYKIWSYDGSAYSSGLSADATTLCNDISTFPYLQGFESGSVPPDCWMSYRGTNNEGASYDWVVNNTNVKTGSYSAFVRYENVPSSAEDWLVSPKITLPNSASSANLSYWERKGGYGPGYNSTYKIRISTTSQTNHNSFSDVESYTENDITSTFTQNIVDMSAYIGQEIYLAFVLIQDDGEDWYLDDIEFNVSNTGNPPVADFSANPTSVCEGNSIQFTDLSTNSPTQYLWDFGDGNNSTIANPSHTYSSSGIYDISLTATNNDGSNTMTKQNHITVNPNPSLSLGNDTIICNTASITLDAGNGYSSYLWSDGSTNQTFSTNSAGTYNVTVNDNNNCTATSSITISSIACNTSCNAPTSLSASNITQNSADLSWVAGGTETVWELTWGQQGFNTGSGSLVSMLNNPNYNLSGLTANTAYDYYVKADCGFGTGNTNLSVWAGPFTFTTATTNCTPNSSTDTYIVCDSFTWSDGVIYTSTNNTATQTLTNSAGCDSVVTLNLTITSSNSSTDIQSSCNSFTWIDGNTYNTSNNSATQILTNSAGCDSVVTLNLTITSSNSSTDIQSACDSFTWIDGNNYTSSNSSATQTLTNTSGCDSIITLNLTINNSFNNQDTISACDQYLWNNNTYLSSGIYFDSTNTISGCDSISSLLLTINFSFSDTSQNISCDIYSWEGTDYTSSGLYTKTFTTAEGCDSLKNLELVINSSYSDTNFVSNCDSFSWNNQQFNQSGIYVDSNLTINGCDSIKYLNLEINNSYNDTLIMSVCDTLFWNNSTYTSSGYHSNSFSSLNNCDSIVTIDLSVNETSTTPLNLQLILDDYCRETYWTVKDSYDSIWQEDGPFNCNPNGGGPQANDTLNVDIYLPANECYTFELHDQYGDGMSASTWGGIDGSWILNDYNGNLLSQGSGNFGNSVEVNFIVDSVAISTISEIKSTENNLKAYPNPLSDNTLISITNFEGPFNVELFDLNGKVVFKQKSYENKFYIECQNLSKGIYWLAIKNQPKLAPLKLVIE